jgi:UDP-N-acetylmuramoyl-tripeptide--D-alanyl-D-alanine ligase
MLAVLLSEKYSVSKTKNNNNNYIGVPLTILNTTEKHEMLIAELGTNHFGEIPYTSKIISPDYALITNIGKSHTEFLKDKKGIWKEKSSLFDETIKNNGTLFINYDDLFVRKYRAKKNRVVKYSLKARTDVTGRIKNYTDDGKPMIEISKGSKNITAELPVYGEQSAKSFVAAAAVALEFGITKSKLLYGLKELKPAVGRMNVIHLKNSVLIDDTYNANPESTQAAIELVGKIKFKKKKILFLGDMLELGKNEIKLHREIAKSIFLNEIDEAYTIGKRMKHLSEALRNKKLKSKHFYRRDFLISAINKMNFEDAVILVKGSRGMRMEEFLAVIKSKANN